MARGYWLMKSEPFKYSWDELVKDGKTYWDGVRNYEARNNMAAMKKGDLAFYYHSNEGKEIVGIAEIVGESYPDPTADDPQWVVVDVAPVVPFTKPVTLAEIKADPNLEEIALVKRGRLSVVRFDSQKVVSLKVQVGVWRFQVGVSILWRIRGRRV